MDSFELSAIDNDKTKVLETFYQFLIKKYAEKKRVLLVIDEAQNLSDEALEEVRMKDPLYPFADDITSGFNLRYAGQNRK